MSTAMIHDPYDLQRVMRTDFVVSDQQWQAISAPLEPAVVIAGAGSGKTALMAARVVYLVANDLLAPDEVLGLTFTRKAAAELRQRIRAALIAAGRLGEADQGEPTVATYHSYAAGLLVDHGLRVGHEPDTRVLSDATRFQLAGRVVTRHRGVVEGLSSHLDTVVTDLLALDAELSEHLVAAATLRDFDATERKRFLTARGEEEAGKARKTYLAAIDDAISAIDRRGELLGLVEEYRAAKHRAGLMDFSDQVALGARLVAEHPEVARLERERFGVVLLDEYQDTSVAQARLLSGLFSGPNPELGRGHAVTAVGDPNQAIYGWRGASVSNILHFGDDFPRADGTTDVPAYPLTVNRRSDSRILDVANALAAPLYDERIRPLQPQPGAGPGEIVTIVHEHVSHEVEWLVEQVRHTHDGEGVAWREIGVLVRDNAHAAEVFDALITAGVPVEIVGLSGLLRLPEVAEVVATLRLLYDVAANDALLTLLTGPRWAIGPRDLALLGTRAHELGGAGRRPRPDEVIDELRDAVTGSDPVDLAALGDALADPGDLPYSAEARERFALLAAELRRLRASVGDPLVDLVRRVVDTCGIEIELAASVSPAAVARRDNLDAFLAAVADFRGVDGDATLPAFIAYLSAEETLGDGLDVAGVTDSDSVKLLTVHRSKGLEWDVVFVLGVGEDRFPSSQGRGLWTRRPGVLPHPLRGDVRDLAVLRGHDKPALDQFRADSTEVEAAEELRLGYVAFTRARHRLVVSSYVWGSRKKPHGPSAFHRAVRECQHEWGQAPLAWIDAPDPTTPNPFEGWGAEAPWPVPTTPAEVVARRGAAERVTAMIAGRPPATSTSPSPAEAERIAEWDAEIGRLLAEARAAATDVVEVPLPAGLSATALMRLHADPAAFIDEMVRPMPRPPAPAAAFGTRFHAWVESRFGQQQMLDPDDLFGRGDSGIDDDADLAAVIAAFESGPFADRAPFQVEAPFSLVLEGHVIRGRIDAVYREPDGSWLVVDWKTNRHHTADPYQLSVYRRAWAELQGVPQSQVRAVFHYVRSGETVHPELPDVRLMVSDTVADVRGDGAPAGLGSIRPGRPWPPTTPGPGRR